MAVPRRWMLGAGVALLGVGALVANAFVVTEQDRVAAFANAVTGRVTTERIDYALRWVDPVRQPLEVTAYDGTAVYDRDNAAELRPRVLAALHGHEGETFRSLRRTIEVQQATATVTMQLFSGQGLVEAHYTLYKHGRDWLVGSARYR